MKNDTTMKNTETIGDFVSKHKNNNRLGVYINVYQEQYLNKEDSELFVKLTLCTIGSTASADIRKFKVYVWDDKIRPYTTYDYDCPVVEVYKDLIAKMTKDVEHYMLSLKGLYTKYKELRIWDFYNAGIWNTIILFGKDYGIEFKEGYDESIKARYIDVVGICDNDECAQ